MWNTQIQHSTKVDHFISAAADVVSRLVPSNTVTMSRSWWLLGT